MPEPFLRLPAVLQYTGLSRSSLYLEMAAGTFPRPVKVGERSVAWPESWITQWQEERIAATRSAQEEVADAQAG